MKIKSHFLLLVCMLFTVYACDDFLEQESQDLIIPQNVSHYQELLNGEGNYKDLIRKGWWINTMSDDMTLFESADPDVTMIPYEFQIAQGCYTWQNDIEYHLKSDNVYKLIYHNILAANTCLVDLDETVGTTDEKLMLEGRARFVRAYGYFLLANLYSQAYNESDPKNTLCVPLYLDSKPVNDMFARNTVETVWKQIKTDIESSITCLSSVEQNYTVYEINIKAALLLGARVALYMEDYDKAIDLAEKFLNECDALYDISGVSNYKEVFLSPVVNDEIVYNFGGNYEYDFIPDYINITQYAWKPSEAGNGKSLISQYKSEDKRLKVFFDEPSVNPWMPIFNKERWLPKKYKRSKSFAKSISFRSAEIYLTLAEAYARKSAPNNEKALQYLNALRMKRIANCQPVSISDFSNQEDFIQEVWNERRRELCFEEFHRWWDLRRIGQPEIQHIWKGEKVYKLSKNDPAYVLDFPLEERNFNKNLIGNQRPNRSPINY